MNKFLATIGEIILFPFQVIALFVVLLFVLLVMIIAVPIMALLSVF